MSGRTLDDLRQMQALPLHLKVELTKTRIRQWVHEFGVDGVYVSFSGGKDSTVLLHIVRELYPEVPAVFFDTGLEYPEIREFVQRFDNVTLLKPKMNFKKVIEKYGYPFLSKETSEVVCGAKKYLQRLAKKTGYNGSLVDLARSKSKWEMPYRVALCLGEFESYWGKKKTGQMQKDGAPCAVKRSQKKYLAALDAPFYISNKCCDVMKKDPAHKYDKKTGKHPITAQMAVESKLRENNWVLYGCNGFDLTSPISNPMSFWTEQDVLQYIKTNNIEICEVYGDIVVDEERSATVEGQMKLRDDGTFFVEPSVLKTTGCSRTGCMFCGFGCHREKEGDQRFVKMKTSHPKQYEWIMKPWNEGGLGYKEVIDWLNENCGLNIKY